MKIKIDDFFLSRCYVRIVCVEFFFYSRYVYVWEYEKKCLRSFAHEFHTVFEKQKFHNFFEKKKIIWLPKKWENQTKISSLFPTLGRFTKSWCWKWVSMWFHKIVSRMFFAWKNALQIRLKIQSIAKWHGKFNRSWIRIFF